MTNDRRAQIEQAIAAIRTSELPANEKLELLGEVLQETSMSSLQGAIRAAQSSAIDDSRFNGLVARALILLPLQRTESLPIRTPDETARLIEMEVRQTLNEKFTKSPAFMLLLAIVAVGVTIFSYGLYTFSSSVKRADQVADEFEKRLKDANEKIATDERELRKRMNTEIDGAVTKINAFQSDSLKALSADLDRRIGEVETKKTDAIRRMDGTVNAFQHEKEDAVKSVTDQASKTMPRVDKAADDAVASLGKERDIKLKAFAKRADQILAELSQPAIKMVLQRSYWLIVFALGASLLSLTILSLRPWRARK